MSLNVEIVEVQTQPAAVIKIKTSKETIGEDMVKAYEALQAHIGQIDTEFAGPPFAIYYDVCTPTWSVGCGVPVSNPITDAGDIEACESPSGKAAMVWHIGPYDKLSETWETFAAWFKEQGHDMSNLCWENYVTDPQAEPDTSKWKTQLFWAV